MMLTVADILTRNVISVSPETTLNETAILMAKHKISCLIVVSDTNVAGIITESDLVRAGSLQLDLQVTIVGELISHSPITVALDQNVYEAFDFLIEHHIRHLVVVGPEGRLEGLVTFTDILKAVAFDDYLKAKLVVDEMSRNVATLDEQASVLDALNVMNRLGISCVIINRNGRATGIFTERDVADLMADQVDSTAVRLVEVMVSPLRTMHETASLLEVSIAMREAGIRRMVIVDGDGKASGILTQFDVIRGLEGQRVRHFKTLHEQAEGKLLESQRLLAEKSELERIVMASPAVLYRCAWSGDSEHGKFSPTYFSPQLQSVLGYEPEAFLQMSWWKAYVHPDDLEPLLLFHQKLIVSGEDSLTYRVRASSGIWIWILDHARVRRAHDGTPQEMVGSWLDVSGHMAAEEQLRHSEEKYRQMVESSNDAIFVADTESGLLIDANEQAEKMLGISREKIIGMHQSQLHPPEEAERYGKIFAEHIRDDRAFIPDLLVRRADGSDVPIDISANVTEVRGRRIIQGIFRDISERKAAEQEIAQAAERMTRVLNADFDAIIVHQDEKVVFSNKQAQVLFGYASAEEAMGEDALGCFLPEQRSFAARIARRAIRTGKPVGRLEMMGLSRIKSEPFPMEIASTPIQWAGKPAVVSIVRDITRRKLAEQQLETERAAMRAILNNLPFMAWLKDENSAYLAVNENFAKVCGAANTDELIGKTDLDLWPEEMALDYRRDDREVMESGQPKNIVELARIKGENHWVETFKSPLFDADDKVVGTVGTANEITDRMQSEEQMRLLKSAVASVSESIIITDTKGLIVYVNPSFTRNTGFAEEDALGKTPAILNSRQQSKGFYQQFWQTIKQGKPWAGRILDRKKDGTIFPVHLSVAPIVDAEGNLSHFVSVHEDLSDAEVMQKKMVQSQKMEAVGTMVGGVAHDFNNLLASIVGNLYMMRKRYKDDEKTVHRIKGMEASVQHGAQLIQQMLTFARKDRTEMHAMDLKGFIKEAYKLADASVPENISFRLQYPSGEDIWIKGDAGQLQQVLLNLVTNAQYAVAHSNSPEIVVELSSVQPDSRLLAKYPEMESHDSWCCLSCSDNGCGIDSTLIERAFEPFFTTKAVGKGTGLGLAMVYGAVQNHHGIVEISSELNQGTVVTIYLPVHKAEAVKEIRQDEVEVDGQGMMILLVDDERGLRDVLSDVLTLNGFVVLQASDGEQAVELYEKQRAQIKLVLMDVVMPVMGGVIAARKIRELSSDVPIIFQTGYGEKTQLDAAAAIARSYSLQKPVQIPELMKMIVERIAQR